MSKYVRLPKGHTSILSPQFRYVPAAVTDLAATFARVHAQHLQPQPALVEVAHWRRVHQLTDDVPELGIEVLEAAWLASPPCRCVSA